MVCLILGFAFLWFRAGSTAHVPTPDVAYAKFGPVGVQLNGYAFSATLAVQTSAEDTEWANQNKQALNDVLHAALSKVDPATLRKPANFLPLQETLKAAANTAFNTDRVQSVLITDFVMESDNN
jgi:flagellar basal body-associated protein FliL